MSGDGWVRGYFRNLTHPHLGASPLFAPINHQPPGPIGFPIIKSTSTSGVKQPNQPVNFVGAADPFSHPPPSLTPWSSSPVTGSFPDFTPMSNGVGVIGGKGGQFVIPQQVASQQTQQQHQMTGIRLVPTPVANLHLPPPTMFGQLSHGGGNNHVQSAMSTDGLVWSSALPARPPQVLGPIGGPVSFTSPPPPAAPLGFHQHHHHPHANSQSPTPVRLIMYNNNNNSSSHIGGGSNGASRESPQRVLLKDNWPSGVADGVGGYKGKGGVGPMVGKEIKGSAETAVSQ